MLFPSPLKELLLFNPDRILLEIIACCLSVSSLKCNAARYICMETTQMWTGTQFTPALLSPNFCFCHGERSFSASTNESCVCFIRKQMTQVTWIYKLIPPKDLKWKKNLWILTIPGEWRVPVGSARMGMGIWGPYVHGISLCPACLSSEKTLSR